MSIEHPMQPIAIENGRARFKENKIVSFLLEYCNGRGVGLNELAGMPWNKGDYEQLMQLIGYSVDGYCELSRVSDQSKNIAEMIAAKLKPNNVSSITRKRA